MSPDAHAIETLSGAMFDFDNPRAQDVDINDIAVALGNTCRFGGHVKRYYSVAEHACLVHRLVRDAGYAPEVCLAALHHDSHEAYLGDVPTPLKRLMGEDRHELEREVDLAIGQRLAVDLTPNSAIKAADSLALSYEAAVLKPSGKAQRHGAWVQVAVADVPGWAVQGFIPAVATHRFLVAHERAVAACS